MLFQNFVDLVKTLPDLIIESVRSNQPYWVEIKTEQPRCIYYFGPFDTHAEANQMQDGYIEDLVEEQATGISVRIKRCMPTKLTITEEEEPV